MTHNSKKQILPNQTPVQTTPKLALPKRTIPKQQAAPLQTLFSMHVFFSFLFLASFATIQANLITRAKKKITRSYNKAKKVMLEEYHTFVTENLHPQETVWDWDSMPKENIQLPANFLWGSRSETTIAEKAISETGVIEQKTNIAATINQPFNTYYLPIDWNAIEPQEGQFNQELLRQHAHLCTQLAQKNIKPIITLFENSAPQWFTDKEGFLNYQNLPLYVRYATKVFTSLAATPAYWIPFLNPNEYARTIYPDDLADLLDCLEHMLIAHRDTYKALKKMIGADHNILIGISKHMDPIKAWNIYNPLEQHRAQKLDQALDIAFYNFINKGSMEIYFSEVTKNDFAHSTSTSFDFIAITYTGQRYLQSDSSLTCHPNKNSLYAQGLYAALKSASFSIRKKIPILVIESDPIEPNTIQSKHIMQALQKAYAEKCSILGYIYQ